MYNLKPEVGGIFSGVLETILHLADICKDKILQQEVILVLVWSRNSIILC